MIPELAEKIATLATLARLVARWLGQSSHPALTPLLLELAALGSEAEEAGKELIQVGVAESEELEAIYRTAGLFGKGHPATRAMMGNVLRQRPSLGELTDRALILGNRKSEHTSDSILTTNPPFQLPAGRVDTSSANLIILAEGHPRSTLFGAAPDVVAQSKYYDSYYLAVVVAPPTPASGQSPAINCVAVTGFRHIGPRQEAFQELLRWSLANLDLRAGDREISVISLEDALVEQSQFRSLSDPMFANVVRPTSLHLKHGFTGTESSANDSLVSGPIREGIRWVFEHWLDRSVRSASELAQAGNLPASLYDIDVRVANELFDRVQAGSELEPSMWETVVMEAATRGAQSVLSRLLDRFGRTAQGREDIWETLIAHTRSTIDATGLDFSKSARLVDWLRTYQPEGAEALPGTFRLVWLIDRLQTVNSLGEVNAELQTKVTELGESLLDEDARLVCQADLRNADQESNRFAFLDAPQHLARWQQTPVAVLGLTMWGRVQSSFGQQAAFQGELALADQYFASALDAFARLSDAQSARLDIDRTSIYRAIAALDNDRLEPSAAKAMVLGAIDLSERAIASMAANDDWSAQYRHHLLLRYLVQAGTPEERRSYLEQRAFWRVLPGHPWPLIDAYRGLLLAASHGRAESLAFLRRGWSAAIHSEAGPTIRIIGAALGVIYVRHGGNWPEVEKVFSDLGQQVPQALERLETMRRALKDQGKFDVMTFLRSVLPFNFH